MIKNLFEYTYVKTKHTFCGNTGTNIYSIYVKDSYFKRYRLHFNTCFYDRFLEYLKKELS